MTKTSALTSRLLSIQYTPKPPILMTAASNFIVFPLLMAMWLAAAMPGRAQLNIPGADGSDGALETPARMATVTNVIIDLSQAVTGKWDQNNAAHAGKGVYDPEKWAVVFKYSSVNIRSNTVIRFKNHPSRAPVVWLVAGDVIIAGEVNLSGNAPDGFRPAEPGPGGFRGGVQAGQGLGGGPGFGPGGGNLYDRGGAPGAYAISVNPSGNATAYGNTQIIPLLGGSGSGSINDGRSNGGSGGGAILIAARQQVSISGRVISQGGPTSSWWPGSCGAIRIVGSQIAGRGELNAAAGDQSGRIRLETPSYIGNLQVFPTTLVVAPENPPLLWPRDSAPTARIVSVGSNRAPVDPVANLEPDGADISMQDEQAVDVLIETTNLDIDSSSVILRVSPRHGGARLLPASFSSGTSAKATWIATVALPRGFCALQVRAVGR